MTLRKAGKWLVAAAAATVYFTIPGYRYYIIGSWVAYKILSDKQKYRVVRKGSKVVQRAV